MAQPAQAWTRKMKTIKKENEKNQTKYKDWKDQFT